jgi:DNA-directed RNA polymerase specialized sigma24 family protein
LFDFNADRQLERNSIRVVASQQVKQGVEARQRDIYDSHRHRTFALAYYMTGNEIEAEKILTSTFIRAFRAVPEPSGPEIDSALLRELRKRSHLRFGAVAPIPPPAGNTDLNLAGRNVKRTDLEEAIWDLPATERLLFLLRDVEGYSPAAIASLLKISESQVQRGVFTARLRMRRILASIQTQGEEQAA